MNEKHISLVEDRAQCSGCGACMAVCPQRAITMQEDENRCVYPVINHASCIRCGKCLRVCEYREGKVDGQLPLQVYAAAGIKTELVQNSTSGGVFATLAMSWIEQGGLVAGAVMDCAGGAAVYHILSGDAADIQRMQGSKYVQSDASRCYADIQAALKNGQRVLFSGTPCQAAAVRAITGNPEHLLTMELICHGVPPQGMLDDYAKILSRRFGGKLKGFAFREKRSPKSFCARLEVERFGRERKYYLRSHELSFYRYFLEGAIYRENCYSCPYAREKRASDMTIGDYWGVEKHHAGDLEAGMMEKRRDWSCVLVNTAKGAKALQQYGEMLKMHASQLEWAAAENHQLQHPTPKPACREQLLQLYQRGGYTAVENAFIREKGGRVRYYVRMLRQMRMNRKLLTDK